MDNEDSGAKIGGLSGSEMLQALKTNSSASSARVYLDYNATTPLRIEVLDVMRPFFEQYFGNASSLHRAGQKSKAALERARSQCAVVLNCSPEEIIFTGGGTESNNLALRGLVRANKAKGHRIVSSAIEHPSVTETLVDLEESGVVVATLNPAASGRIEISCVEDAIGTETSLVILMYANNETGVVQPVLEVGELCRSRGILFYVDAVQAAGKLPLDVKKIGCDSLALSAHKFGGPLGVGLIYLRDGVLLKGIQTGGSQERGLRAGTVNVPAIVGMAQALTIADAAREGECARQTALRDQLENEICSGISDVMVFGKSSSITRVANTSFLSFKNLDTETVVNALDLEGVEVAAGAACSEGTHSSSRVLNAMGVSKEWASGAIRISLGVETSKDDIKVAIRRILSVVKRLRK